MVLTRVYKPHAFLQQFTYHHHKPLASLQYSTMTAIFAFSLLASAVSAKVLPRGEARTSAFGFPSLSTTLSIEDPTTISPVFPNITSTDFVSVTDTEVFSTTFTDDFPTTSTDDLPTTSSVDYSGTVFIPVPSQAYPYSSTVTACTKADGEVIDSIVILGSMFPLVHDCRVLDMDNLYMHPLL